jgi:two-component system sensor kinase FixL
MASALAHELNQPLSAISNYLRGGQRLLKAGGDMALVTEAMDKAADQAVRAGDIIRRLRAYVARGTSEWAPEHVAKLVEEASALALIGAKELGIQIDLRLDADADLVLVDRVQIQQVLVNLIRNAAEAMAITPRRALTVASAAAEEGMVEVSVRDTGTGLAPEAAEKLFSPFFSTKAHGLGVGLSICRTIIEAHGGRIWAEANPGGGTVFRFTLQAADSNPDTPD